MTIENKIVPIVNDVIKIYKLEYPLDLDSFVDKLRIELKFVDTGKSDGYFLCYNGRKKILIDKNCSVKTRRNFTIGHELGHYFIEDHLKPIYDCNVNGDGYYNSCDIVNKVYEKEADAFSAEIILPTSIFLKTKVDTIEKIRTLSSIYGLSIPASAIKMMKNEEEPMAFGCAINGRIKWITSSIGETEHCVGFLKGCRLPSTSSVFRNIGETGKSEISAFGWVKSEYQDGTIEEEFLRFKQYNTIYFLLKLTKLYNQYGLY